MKTQQLLSLVYGVLGVGLFVMPQPVMSHSLRDAFSALTSTANPGAYHNQVRGYINGGSFHTHFPSYAVDVVGLSPPHYTAGCRGIDIYLGGLSYISGKQFVHLLKSIAANTMGYSFGITMRTLCPVCATTVSQLQKIAQTANQFSIKQCQLSMGLVNAVNSEQAKQYTTSLAALESARLGKTTDFLAGMNSIGDDVSKALTVLAKPLALLHDKGSQLQALQTMPLGSDTWKALSGLDRFQKVFIQSLLGTTLRYPYPYDRPKTIRVVPIAASMSLQQLVDLLMYGVLSKYPDNAKLWVNECVAVKRGRQTTINKLLSAHDAELCQHVVKRRIDQSDWYYHAEPPTKGVSLVRHGFFGIIYALLSQAVINIKQGQALGTPATITLPRAIYASGKLCQCLVTFSASDITSLIGKVPLPLYQAVHLAAVYPSIGNTLINSLAKRLSVHYALAYIEQRVLNTRRQGNHAAGLVGLSPDKLDQLHHRLTHLRERLQHRDAVSMSRGQSNDLGAQQIKRLQKAQYGDMINALPKGWR